jgi:hypothetical protein
MKFQIKGCDLDKFYAMRYIRQSIKTNFGVRSDEGGKSSIRNLCLAVGSAWRLLCGQVTRLVRFVQLWNFYACDKFILNYSTRRLGFRHVSWFLAKCSLFCFAAVGLWTIFYLGRENDFQSLFIIPSILFEVYMLYLIKRDYFDYIERILICSIIHFKELSRLWLSTIKRYTIFVSKYKIK